MQNIGEVFATLLIYINDFLYEESNMSKVRCQFTSVISSRVRFDFHDLYRQTISAKRLIHL